MIQLLCPQNLNTMLYQISSLPGDVRYTDNKSVWALVGKPPPLESVSSSVYRQHKQCLVGNL